MIRSKLCKILYLPDIGEGIVECEVVKWLVTQGQEIIEDQPVVEVMTDKALVEIPAKYSGVVTTLYYAEGDIAKVHSPLFAMQITDENSVPQQDTSSVKGVETTETNVSNTVTTVTSKLTHTDTEKKNTGKALASPAVRRLARELEIDLSQIAGSGDKGRVLKDDLSVSASPTLESVVITPNITGGKRVEPIRGIQGCYGKTYDAFSFYSAPF